MLKEAEGSASLPCRKRAFGTMSCRRRAFGTMKKRSKKRFPFGDRAVIHAPMDRNFLLLFVIVSKARFRHDIVPKARFRHDIVPKARLRHDIVPEARLRHGNEAFPSVP
jgi:hypothetical protein